MLLIRRRNLDREIEPFPRLVAMTLPMMNAAAPSSRSARRAAHGQRRISVSMPVRNDLAPPVKPAAQASRMTNPVYQVAGMKFVDSSIGQESRLPPSTGMYPMTGTPAGADFGESRTFHQSLLMTTAAGSNSVQDPGNGYSPHVTTLPRRHDAIWQIMLPTLIIHTGDHDLPVMPQMIQNACVTVQSRGHQGVSDRTSSRWLFRGGEE